MSNSTEIDFQKINVRKLEEGDNLSCFNCTQEDEMGLDEFIHKEALYYRQSRLGITYLFFYEKKKVGFITLSMGDIRAEQIEKGKKMPVNIKTYPALYVGRLAVDNQYRKRKIGRFITQWCIGFALNISEQVGCRYITLHTTKPRIPFYEKCNFSSAMGEESHPTVLMYLKVILQSEAGWW